MYSYNPYYGEYLAHYGVLGMKWGVRKAKTYAKDLNRHRRNKAINEARLQKNRGQITKEQYKALKKNIKAQQKEANARDIEKIKSDALKGKGDPSKKAADIYTKYKNKAYKEIPHYFAKRGLSIAGNALITLHAIGTAATLGSYAAGTKLLYREAIKDIGIRNAASTVIGSASIPYSVVKKEAAKQVALNLALATGGTVGMDTARGVAIKSIDKAVK